MSDTPPVIGQEEWGDDLNAYLASLEDLIAAMGVRVTALESRVASVESQGILLELRVEDLETHSEYVYNSYPWQYSNSSPPPTGNQVRFDNANLSLATVMVARLIDSDGADRTLVFQQLNAQSRIRINDWDDASLVHYFDVTGPANIASTDATVPVAWTSGSGTIPNVKVNIAFLVAITI